MDWRRLWSVTLEMLFGWFFALAGWMFFSTMFHLADEYGAWIPVVSFIVLSVGILWVRMTKFGSVPTIFKV